LLTLLKEFPHAKGVGVDISKKAIAIAEKNSYNLKVESAEFISSDWLETVKNNTICGTNFELIVSNPPYISLLDAKNLDKELNFEPETALFAADEGLKCYKKIAETINDVNFKYLILEIGINQETEVIEIFKQHNIKFLRYYKDLNGIIRTLTFTN
jgi:release factor glutamine methyltransferase